MTLETLRVFTHSDCPHSKALLEDFIRRGVVFVQIDVGSNPSGLQTLRAICWEHRLPVIADHEKITIGYQGRTSTFEALGLEDL